MTDLRTYLNEIDNAIFRPETPMSVVQEITALLADLSELRKLTASLEKDQKVQKEKTNTMQAEIARLEDFIRRFRAKASKASQVQSRVKTLEKMKRLEAPRSAGRRLRFRFPPAPNCGDPVISVRRAGMQTGDVVTARSKTVASAASASRWGVAAQLP